jgi:hypothetical protein
MLSTAIVLAALAVTPAAGKPAAAKTSAKAPKSDGTVPLDTAPAGSPRYVAGDLELPALGTDRRVVLSNMRRGGLHMTEGAGSQLVFDGGPIGWLGVDKSTFDFDGMALDQIDLQFATPADDVATRNLFLSLRSALAGRYGLPWFDRVRDGDASQDHGVDALSMQSHQTSWANDGIKVQLSATYGHARSVRVLVSRDAHTERAHELTRAQSEAADADTHWGAQELTNMAMVSRLAADSLFDDFGEQPLIIQGAKLKGKPVTVRLRSVKIPKGMTGFDEATVAKRFERFVDGHWDVDAVASKSAQPDVDLVVDIVPLSKNQTNTYAMRLSAVVATGKQKGETMYTAIQALR